MALTSALNTTLNGIQLTESRINVVSDNVTNADKAGYTRKELSTNYTTVGETTVALSSTLTTSNYDMYLFESLIADTSSAASYQVISDYLSAYANSIGTLDGEGTITSLISGLNTAISELSASPEDDSLKAQVVGAALRVANELNRLSSEIQDYRLEIDIKIEKTVETINSLVSEIDGLNQKILQYETAGQSTANLEDERRSSLQELSELIDIDYFINSSNEVQIYTASQPLLDSKTRDISYTAASNLDKNVTYPSSLAPIELNGNDLTTTLAGGELAGLVALRDEYLVEEQAKLDTLALTLTTQLNTLLNEGAQVSGRSEIIGDTVSVPSAFTATGNVQIATVDTDGVIQNTATIDLSTVTTTADLVTAINTALGGDVTASITADGSLQLIANNSGEGIAMNQLTSAVDNGTNTVSFSSYFGLNNLFSASEADTIAVSQYLLDGAFALSTGTLSTTSVIGEAAIYSGDASVTSAMNDAFTTKYSINASGNFSATTNSFDNYAALIVGDVASRASDAESNMNIAVSLMTQTQDTLTNMSAVNIDEELANLLDLQAKYEASATMISTIQELFDALMAAVR